MKTSLFVFRGRSLQTSVSVTRRESSVSSPTPSSSTSTRRAPGCIWRNRRSSSNTYSSSWRKKIKEHKPVQPPTRNHLKYSRNREWECLWTTTLPIKISGLLTSDSVTQQVFQANLDPRSSTWTRQASGWGWEIRGVPPKQPSVSGLVRYQEIQTTGDLPLNKSEINLSSYNKAPWTPDTCQSTHQNYRRSLGWNLIIINNRWFLYCFLAIKKRFWMSNFMPKRQESTQLKHKGSKFMYLIWIQNDGKDLHVQTRKLSSCV